MTTGIDAMRGGREDIKIRIGLNQFHLATGTDQHLKKWTSTVNVDKLIVKHKLKYFGYFKGLRESVAR